MKKHAYRLPAAVFWVAFFALAASCTYPISKQLRKEAQQEHVSFKTVLANPAAYAGRIVLWGGRIIKTTNKQNGTDIIVLQTPLDYLDEPENTQASQGRFIARSTEFLDPAVYSANREITLAGEVIGPEEQTLGKTTYTYPVVQVKELHLWQRYYRYYYPDDYYWYDPFWGPYFYPGPGYFHGYHEHDEDHGWESHGGFMHGDGGHHH